ncbi:helix-turn-helix transcriptional regulator [Leptolyngbya sp. FACHB-261]|nr:helix-turn-helix transcriptional regulator [Leptolyngbya sp. FACHB-261]
MLQVLSCAPLLSSRQAGWQGIYFEYYHLAFHDTPEHYFDQHLIGTYIGKPSENPTARKLDRRFEREWLVDGDTFFLPAYTRHQTSSNAEAQFLMIGLEPALQTQVAYESVHPDSVELIPHFSKPDPLVHQLGLALKAELEANDGTGSRLYAESAATFLATHLLRHYSTRKHTIRNYAGGLTKHKLRQAVEYINEHLAEDVSLQAIALELNMSHYYFCRLFKRSMGITPYQYLIQQRVERAKQLLKQKSMPIADIASQIGFSDQSHFTKQFRQYTGITPKAFRDS